MNFVLAYMDFKGLGSARGVKKRGTAFLILRYDAIRWDEI
jgi:hypothetical protein